MRTEIHEAIAVVDVETTGLSPWRHNRVVEIAVVLLDREGNNLDEYETLVNPGRDVGPTSIHGITATDVLNAPSFSEIAGDVVALLSRAAVLAGHNVTFDRNFLISEFERLPARFPDVPLFCTCAQLGRQNLAACCAELGIELDSSAGDFHSALFDARATAKIVAHLVAEEPSLVPLPATRIAWPSLVAKRARAIPRSVARRVAPTPAGFLQRLASRNVHDTEASSPNVLAYLGLLDRVLEDRTLDADERQTLSDTVERLGLSKNQVLGTHLTYLQHLAAMAVADGIVTARELDDLRTVTRLLGMETATLETLLARTREQLGNFVLPQQNAEQLKGKRVCFTGELQAKIGGTLVTRPVAQQLAERAGMVTAGNVSKKLDFLIAADANTQSGKARKAREYGVRVVAEPDFWAMIGVAVQ